MYGTDSTTKDINQVISVIIPAYNVEGYIERCLSSVIEQTYKNLEIIIVNDGSTDGTERFCKSFEHRDKRIKYYKTSNNGRAAARNFGIANSNGEYITFLDADDWWDNDFALSMLNCLEATEGHAEIAICDIAYVDSCTGAEMLSEIRLAENKSISIIEEPDLINICRVFLWGKLYKKSLLSNNHFSLTPGIMEDFPIVPLLVAKAKGVIRVANKLQFYLRNRDGNSSSNIALLSRDYEGGIKKLIENFKENNLWGILERPLYKMAYSQVRFALQQANKLRNSECSTEVELRKLEINLTKLLEDNWNRKSPVSIQFAWRGDEAVYQGLKRVVISDSQIVDHDQYDFLVTNEIIKHPELSGERLYWDIADEILYSIK